MKLIRWTIAIFLLAALVNIGWLIGDAPLAERVASWLQFDRSAVASGQLWRLVTCHLVHFSAGHFWIDLLPWAAIGLAFERRLGLLWPAATLLGMASIGLAVWLGLPDVDVYRGWSGLVNTAMAAGLLAAWEQSRVPLSRWERVAFRPGEGGPQWSRCAEYGSTRFAGVPSPAGKAAPSPKGRGRNLILFLAAVWIAKISYEAATGRASFSHTPIGAMGDMVPLAHWTGAAAGFAGFALARAIAWARSPGSLVLIAG